MYVVEFIYVSITYTYLKFIHAKIVLLLAYCSFEPIPTHFSQFKPIDIYVPNFRLHALLQKINRGTLFTQVSFLNSFTFSLQLITMC